MHQFLQLNSRETMLNAFWGKKTRRFGSKYSQRNIQKFRNKENTIVISKTLIYSAGTPDSLKERRSGWGRMEMRRNKKRIASGKNSIHVHSKHPFRSCLHR